MKRRAKFWKCIAPRSRHRGGDSPDGRRVKIHHPLGLGRPCHRRRGAPLRQPVHVREPRRGARGPGFHRQSQPEFAGGRSRLQTRPASATPPPAPVTNSSASAISVSTWIRSPKAWSSTAPPRCATPGPKSKNARVGQDCILRRVCNPPTGPRSERGHNLT